MKRRVISTIAIFIGVLLMAYPKIYDLYSSHIQKKLIMEWNQSFLNIEEGYEEIQNDELISTDKQNTEHLSTEINNSITEPLDGKKQKEDEKKQRDEYIKKNMEGILKIDRIKLNLPILKGATEKNLKISVGSIRHTGSPGGTQNYCIAGHRSHSYGKNFNRLDELQIGDIIEVEDGKNIYKYVVEEKLYVEPGDTWVLNSRKRKKEITLVTCHPIVKPTHRLIIKGSIME